MKKGIFFWVLFLTSFVKIVPQEFTCMTLPVRHLLPASVCCVFQDIEGYIWYGTRQAGICRDNGYQLDVFCPSEISHRAESNYITCICERSDSTILIGTAHGLFALSKRDYSMRAIALDEQKIESMFTDSHGHTWVGLNGKVYMLDNKNTGEMMYSLKEFTCHSTNKDRPVNCLFEDSHGTLFALEWLGGVLVKHKNEKSFTPLKLSEPLNPVSIIEDPEHNDNYWVLTRYHGVVTIHVDGLNVNITLHPYTMSDSGRKRGLGFVYDQRHGLLWVTTMDNLYAYSIKGDGELIPFPIDHWVSSESKILDAPFMMRNGAIYVPASLPQTFIVMTNENHITRLTVDDIRAVSGYPLQTERSLKQKDGIWMWHQRAGLLFYDVKSEHIFISPESLTPWFCNDSYNPNSIWASHGSALYHVTYNNGHINSQHICVMPDSQEIRGIYEHEKGTIYVTTMKHVYNLSLIGNHPREMFETYGLPQDFSVTNQHYFWITEGYLRYRQKEDVHNKSIMNTVHGLERTVAITADREGTIWAATQDGEVYHYFPVTDSLARIDFMHSENGAPFMDIDADGIGHVWTLTEQQVREYNPTTGAFRTLLANSQDIDVSYFHSLEFQDANHLCINGAGAICLVESSTALDQHAEKVVPRISAYTVNDKKYYPQPSFSELNLHPQDEDVILYLTTLNQYAAANITFAYKLKELNHKWIYGVPGDNVIHLNKLPVGKYELQVMATDHNGCWSEPVNILIINSLPPWYKTLWANILWLILFVLICVGVWRLEQRIRLLHRLIRRREQVKLNEIEMTFEDITTMRLNDKFLHKAVQTVEEHLTDSQFNVKAMADIMCMSRANLHRHLKAQTGLSPTDFIRDIRLKKAAQIFASQKKVTITDVAVRVGFATPKYLSKCFKEKFGVAPKEYAEKCLQ